MAIAPRKHLFEIPVSRSFPRLHLLVASALLALALTGCMQLQIVGSPITSTSSSSSIISSGETILHSFLPPIIGYTDGASPLGDLLLSGSTFYGLASGGGSSGLGTIFSIQADGSGFTVLHNFAGGAADGASPQYEGLIISGSTLYGTTQGGGSGNSGTVFSIQTDGSGFTLIHSFSADGASGASPPTGVVLSGSTLYGVAGGGSSGNGIIFSVGTDGSSFTVLHNFAGVADGSAPYSTLVVSGSMLYGTTEGGGASSDGTVFSIGTDGSGFTVLHVFSGADGRYPYGGLILSGSTLYGMNWGGTIYSIGTDGSSFTSLHTLVGGGADGEYPFGHLLLSGSTLYGMAQVGGPANDGVIFSLATDGSGFTLLHSFSGAVDGSTPLGSLIVSGSTLYGMVTSGGSGTDGTIFSIATDGSSFSLMHSFSGLSAVSDGAHPNGDLTPSSDGSTLYGVTSQGGANNDGVIFSIGADGSGFTLLHTFSGSAADGSLPYGSLILSGNTLYGMTMLGGSAGDGTIFSIGTDGSGFNLLHSFLDGAADGKYPFGGLILSGGNLYGMTEYGGTGSNGTIFSVATAGSGFALLHSFVGGAADGANPQGNLVLSGSTLYGMTVQGGGGGIGTIFSVATDGSGFALLHTFVGGVADGEWPYGSLTLVGGTLYGMSGGGGGVGCYGQGCGTIFSIGSDGSSFTLLHSFTGSSSDGSYPSGSLLLSGSTLYGMTSGGGSSGGGVIFSIGEDGSGFSLVQSFNGGSTDGQTPGGSLILVGSKLYGMAGTGGANGGGVVFSYGL